MGRHRVRLHRDGMTARWRFGRPAVDWNGIGRVPAFQSADTSAAVPLFDEFCVAVHLMGHCSAFLDTVSGGICVDIEDMVGFHD